MTKIKIWAILRASIFTSESSVELFTNEEKAITRWHELRTQFKEDYRHHWNDLVVEEDGNMSCDGMIVTPNTLHFFDGDDEYLHFEETTLDANDVSSPSHSREEGASNKKVI